MSWLAVRTARPLAVVLALFGLVFALFAATGCGRSGFDDDLEAADAATDEGSDGDALPDVPPPPDSGVLIAIQVAPSAEKLPVGGKREFRATGIYSDGLPRDLTPFATWESSNTFVATASSGGIVVANSPGTARIRARYAGIVGEADLIVTSSPMIDLRIDPPSADLAVGGSQKFTATAFYSDGSSSDVTFSASWSTDNPTVLKVATGIATGVSPGTASVRATFSGRTALAKVSVSGKTLKSIEISPFAPTVGVGVNVKLSATAIYTDGTTDDVTPSATWTSSDASIATVTLTGGTAVATGVKAGTATINAFFGGMSGSTPITVSGGTLTGIAVSPSAATIAPGATAALKATANYSDGSSVDVTTTAVWTSSSTSTATVASGTVTGVAPGTATITASFGGKSGTSTITVSAAKLLSIVVEPSAVTAPLGSKVSLKARGTYEGGSVRDITNDVTWSTDDASVATVSNTTGTKGQVNPLKVGSTKVRAKLDGVEGVGDITVTAAVITSISISPNPLSMVVGTKQFAKATATYSDGTTVDVSTTCTWSSANPTIATVSNGAGAQGQVSAVSTGSTTLYCVQSGVTGAGTVTVGGSTLVQVSVSPISPTCRIGDVLQFQATAIMSNGTSSNVTTTSSWSSSSTAILQPLGFPGRFRCTAKGTATVTATYSGRSGSSTVTVSDAVVVGLQVDPAGVTLAPGSVQQYQATALYSDGTSQNVTFLATWLSTSPSVASVGNAPANKGRATAIAAGTTTIQASWSGVTGSTTLKVSSAVVTSISITPASASLPGGLTFGYNATAIYSDGTSKDVTGLATWSSSNTSVVVVSNAIGSKGQATTVSAGTATVSAFYEGVTGKASITVTTAKLTAVQVTPFNPTLPIGFGIRMTATAIWSDGFTANVTGQSTWTSSDSGVASVSNAIGSRGRVTPISAGSATISAQYAGVTGSTTVKVTSATLSSITISPDPASIGVGGSEQLVATGKFSDGTTLDVTEYVGWTSSDGSIADVSNAEGSKGRAFGFKAGTVTVTATRGTVTAKSTLTVK